MAYTFLGIFKYCLQILTYLSPISSKLVLSIVLLISLAACTPSSILKGALGGGGTNVAANVPIGKEVNQTLGAKVSKDNTVTLRPKSRVDTIDQSSTDSKVEAKTVENLTIQTNVPYWFVGVFIFLLIMWSWLLWKLPSPDQIWKNRKK